MYEGTIDKTINERFNRILKADEASDREEINNYYNNLRKWVRDWFTGRIASEATPGGKVDGKGTWWYRSVGKMIDGHTPKGWKRKD